MEKFRSALTHWWFNLQHDSELTTKKTKKGKGKGNMTIGTGSSILVKSFCSMSSALDNTWPGKYYTKSFKTLLHFFINDAQLTVSEITFERSHSRVVQEGFLVDHATSFQGGRHNRYNRPRSGHNVSKGREFCKFWSNPRSSCMDTIGNMLPPFSEPADLFKYAHDYIYIERIIKL